MGHHTKHILPTTSRLLVRCPTRAPALSLSRLGKDLEISVGRLRVSHGRPRPTPLLAASTQSAAIDHGPHDGLGAAGAVRRSSCVASRRSAKGSGALADRDRRTVTAETQWTVPAYYRFPPRSILSSSFVDRRRHCLPQEKRVSRDLRCRSHGLRFTLFTRQCHFRLDPG